MDGDGGGVGSRGGTVGSESEGWEYVGGSARIGVGGEGGF